MDPNIPTKGFFTNVRYMFDLRDVVVDVQGELVLCLCFWHLMPAKHICLCQHCWMPIVAWGLAACDSLWHASSRVAAFVFTAMLAHSTVV